MNTGRIPLAGKLGVVLALALICAIPYGKAALASLLLGGGIQIVNLRALERAVESMLGLAAAGRFGGAIALVHLRWPLMLAVVALVLILFPVEPIPFLIGLSAIVPAVLWHGLTHAAPRIES